MTALYASLALAAAVYGVAAVLAGAWTVAAAAHVVVALSGWRAVHGLYRPEDPTGRFEAALAACVPLVGGALAWLYVAGTRLGRSAGVAEEFEEYIDPGLRLGEEATTLQRSGFEPDPDHLEPMSDILRSDAGIQEKRIAIEGLARLETPEAVSMLREALHAESTEVRFYAASVLGRLEERLASRLRTLEEDVALGRRLDPDVELDLARSYFDYAYFGVAEGERHRTYLEDAIVHAGRAWDRGAPPRSLLVSGRAHLELGRCEEAEAEFDRYLRVAGKSVAGYLWRAEARFLHGRYDKVIEDCCAAVATGPIPERMQPTVDFWFSRGSGSSRRFRRPKGV